MKLLDSTLKYLLMQLLESTLRLQGKLEHHWSNIGFYSSKQSLFFKRLKGWYFKKFSKITKKLTWSRTKFFMKKLDWCNVLPEMPQIFSNLSSSEKPLASLLNGVCSYDPNHSSFYQAHLVHGNCLFFTGNHGKFFKIPFWIENHTLQPSFNP